MGVRGQDEGQGTRDKGQGTRDKGQGTRDDGVRGGDEAWGDLRGASDASYFDQGSGAAKHEGVAEAAFSVCGWQVGAAGGAAEAGFRGGIGEEAGGAAAGAFGRTAEGGSVAGRVVGEAGGLQDSG